MTTPWIEKYRPVAFNEVVGNTKTLRILSNLGEHKGSIPNLLICGPSGCGKTTCVDILCKQIVKENRDSRILQTSSFDERGIDNVRTTIKTFARGRVKTEENPKIEKIVILDEADSITSGAFQALRNIMDFYSNTTRLIIVCNNSTKIIEPIQSRCAILRFSKVESGELCSRVSQICDMAGVEYTLDGIEALGCVADGDVRSAINSLNSTVSAFARVTAENVYKTCDSLQPATIANIVQFLGSKKDIVRAVRSVKRLCDEGYSPSDIVSSFFKVCTKIEEDETKRLEIAKAIGLTQARVLNGTSTFLQFAALCHTIGNVFND